MLEKENSEMTVLNLMWSLRYLRWPMRVYKTDTGGSPVQRVQRTLSPGIKQPRREAQN